MSSARRYGPIFLALAARQDQRRSEYGGYLGLGYLGLFCRLDLYVALLVRTARSPAFLPPRMFVLLGRLTGRLVGLSGDVPGTSGAYGLSSTTHACGTASRRGGMLTATMTAQSVHVGRWSRPS